MRPCLLALQRGVGRAIAHHVTQGAEQGSLQGLGGALRLVAACQQFVVGMCHVSHTPLREG